LSAETKTLAIWTVPPNEHPWELFVLDEGQRTEDHQPIFARDQLEFDADFILYLDDLLGAYGYERADEWEYMIEFYQTTVTPLG
jgi:hypothetical protein